MPQLSGINLRFNNAQAIWTGAGFSGTVLRAATAPVGNFTITAQSLVYPDRVPCTSSVTVSAP